MLLCPALLHPGRLSVGVLVLSTALYLALLFGAHHKLKDKFGDQANVWPRPDWAFGCAMLGGMGWSMVAAKLRGGVCCHDMPWLCGINHMTLCYKCDDLSV